MKSYKLQALLAYVRHNKVKQGRPETLNSVSFDSWWTPFASLSPSLTRPAAFTLSLQNPKPSHKPFQFTMAASVGQFNRVLVYSDMTVGFLWNSSVPRFLESRCVKCLERVWVWHFIRFLSHFDPLQVPVTRRTHLSGCDASVENFLWNLWPLFMWRTYHCSTLTMFKPTAPCHNIYPVMNLIHYISTFPFKRNPLVLFICIVACQMVWISLAGVAWGGTYVTGKSTIGLRLWLTLQNL